MKNFLFFENYEILELPSYMVHAQRGYTFYINDYEFSYEKNNGEICVQSKNWVNFNEYEDFSDLLEIYDDCYCHQRDCIKKELSKLEKYYNVIQTNEKKELQKEYRDNYSIEDYMDDVRLTWDDVDNMDI